MLNKAIPVALLLLALLGCNPNTNPAAPQPAARTAQPQPRNLAAATQNFDFYLLNLSWSPEFCATHPTAAECAQHRAFTLHGLWPQNVSGPYPQHCSTAPGPQDPGQFSDIYPDQGLLEHEWQTHGTCSGLSPDAFFTLARQAVHSVVIPSELTSLTNQTSMPPIQILALFEQSNPTFPASSLALSCGNNYLTAIEVCMSKTLQPIGCGTLRSCRANTIRIPPPTN